jgi:hypothetical protein
MASQTVRSILLDTARLTGTALEHIVKIIDPDCIVVLSNWLGDFTEMQYIITDTVFSRCVWAKRDVLKILFDKNEYLSSMGPSALVLEKCFQLSDGNILLQGI